MSELSLLKLYDLAGSDEARRTSPYCWRTRLALAYKRLPYESIPWRRVEKDMIAFSGQGKVPVLVHGQEHVFDSWKIAQYLDEHSPDHSLLGGSRGVAEKQSVRFIVHWVDQILLRAIRNIVAHGAIEVSADMDKEYYRNKIQAKHGVQLQSAGGSKENIEELQKALEPMRVTIQEQPFLGGQEPNFADLAVAGAFAWARSVSPIKLLQQGDPVCVWRQRVFSMFEEEFASTVGYDLQ